MKKLIIALLLTSSMSFANDTKEAAKEVYSDSKSVVTTVYKDAKSLAPKIESSIKSLAKGLKVGAESVWDILVKQQLVWSLSILLGVIATIISWIHFWYRYGIACENDWGRNGSANYEVTCIMTALIAISGSVLSVMHFNTMLTGFINPEFGAMKNIAELALQLK